MTTRENQKLLAALVGGMGLIVLAMIVSIFIVTRRPVVIVVPGATPAEAGAPTAGEALPAPLSISNDAAPPAVPVIAVQRVAATPPLTDPFDPWWQNIPLTDLELQPQQVAPPMLERSTLARLRVQAAHDDQRYVWRLAWDQAKPSMESQVNLFSDAVAVQFPLVDGAPYTMGGPGMPVTMLYWKAIWQKDVDEGFQDTVATQPAAHSDLYWFARDTGPQRADQGFDDPASKPWFVAAAAGNPMAQFQRTSPLEELTAQGFGSATHVQDSPSQARGTWRDGQWVVVIDRRIAAGDPLIARFQENPNQQLIAFAVWDGTADNRGGVKHITNWIPMRIDP